MSRSATGTMTLYPCPHCGVRTISVIRRLFLGPAMPMRCSVCHRDVGVPWSSVLVMAPFLVLMCGLMLAFHPSWNLAAPAKWLLAALAVLSFVSSSVIWLRWVPLIKR